MKKNIKYIIFVFLLLVIVHSNRSAEVSAAGEEFEMNSNRLTRYRGDATTVVIPDSVVFISKFAFAWNDKITKVVIPNTVIEIGEYAFDSCTSLKEIIIPDSVSHIRDAAFAYCTSLENIVIPKSASLGDSLFSGCINLKSVTMDTYQITDWMFAGCEKLKILDMEGISRIGEAGFFDCTGLTNINLEWVSTIGPRAFENCTSLEKIELNNDVVEIPDRVFYGCSKLTDIKFSSNISTIGEDAFVDTPWLSICKSKGPFIIINGILVDAVSASGLITIPKEVNTINDYAFYGNSSMTGVTLPKNVSAIGDLAFAYCEKLIAVYIPPTAKAIGDNAFYKSPKLTAIYGSSGSYAEEYAKKKGIKFVAESSATMEKAVNASEKEKTADKLQYEDFVGEVGGSGYFEIESSIMKTFKNCKFESLSKSVITVNNNGNYQIKSKGNALVLLKGTINNKSTIIKVIRVSAIQSTKLPEDISKINNVLGLRNGSVLVSDLIIDEYNVPYRVKLTCYDNKNKEKWTYGLEARAENENSSISYETFYDVTCDKLIELSDGNILAVGGGRGRLTSKTNSQYNVVTATWITKINSKTGDVIWELLMEAGGSCHFFIDTVEIEDGTILLFEDVFDGGKDIVRLDSNGNIISVNNYEMMSNNSLATMNLIASDDGRIITVGNIGAANTFKIFSINKEGKETIETKITVDEADGGGTIGQSAPRILKGNHEDYYIYYWAKRDMIALYHLDSSFKVIHNKELDIGLIQSAYITPEDKIVFIGNGDAYARNGKILIYDCITEKTCSVLLSSYREYYSNSSVTYGGIIGNDSIVVAGTNYYDKKTYLYRVDDIHFMSSTKDVEDLTVSKINQQKYSGKALKPNIKIKNGSKTLVNGKDYKVVYINNKNKGTATAIIYGINDYTGARLLSFKIV
ncbi:MAG: leucine-rich repeat domain-containing protein [Clostridiales bacterium]|jgi:hypothetical protein|nr:leucine-rich repeat domain-containing protein [Clostridiales bacterium]